jgi:hypothetical protein
VLDEVVRETPSECLITVTSSRVFAEFESELDLSMESEGVGASTVSVRHDSHWSAEIESIQSIRTREITVHYEKDVCSVP